MTSPSSEVRELYTIDRTKQHTVYRAADGTRVPGVTTVLGILDKPALLAWAHKMGLEGKDFRKVTSEAADIGTVAHALCEAYLTNRELDQTNIAPDIMDRAENAYLKFLDWFDSQRLLCEASELVMVSESLRVGGTADLIALRRHDEKRLLVDLKTCKGIYREQKIQACAYAGIFEETHPGQRIDEVWIVRIGKEEEGDFEAVQVFNRAECWTAFQAIVSVYYALQRIK